MQHVKMQDLLNGIPAASKEYLALSWLMYFASVLFGLWTLMAMTYWKRPPVEHLQPTHTRSGKPIQKTFADHFPAIPAPE